MEICFIDHKKPAQVICSCNAVPLCHECLPIHLNQAEGIHVPWPIDLYSKASDIVDPFMDANRDNFDKIQNFMANERSFLESVRQYRVDLKKTLEDTKNIMNLQLDSVFDKLDNKTKEIENKILSNLAGFQRNLELSKKTQSIVYDLSSSLDQMIDDFVSQIETLYDIKYKAFELEDPNSSEDWVWSESRKGDGIDIQDNGKTVESVYGRGSILIDQPLTKGKSVWKIKLSKKNNVIIGVWKTDMNLNSLCGSNFWGYQPIYSQKWVKGNYGDWSFESCEGDVIEVSLEFVNDKGVLGFSWNGQFLGTVCDDIDHPVYPFVWFNNIGYQVSLSN